MPHTEKLAKNLLVRSLPGLRAKLARAGTEVEMEGTLQEGRRAPEFLAWAPLAAVALFTFNNFWLKGRAPVVLAGKLSDFAACFFLPLFVAALLAHVTCWSRARRVALGAVTTALVFTLVKTSAAASSVLDGFCAALGSLVALRSPANRVDPTDLLALPMVLLACWWSNNQGRKR
jgi:hypothetical protein